MMLKLEEQRNTRPHDRIILRGEQIAAGKDRDRYPKYHYTRKLSEFHPEIYG